MSKKRYLDTKFWSDPFVVDKLNLIDRHVFLYLMLNEKTSIAGVYELSLRTMSNETGIEQNDLLLILKRLEPKVYYIESWIVLTNFIKNQNYKSPKIKTGIEIVLETCPDNLLQYISWPHDWKMPINIAQKVNYQGSLDLNGYGIDTVSHSNSNSNSNSKVSLDNVSKPLATSPQLKPELGDGYEAFKKTKQVLQQKKGLQKI